MGTTANQACCVCGGGSSGSPTCPLDGSYYAYDSSTSHCFELYISSSYSVLYQEHTYTGICNAQTFNGQIWAGYSSTPVSYGTNSFTYGDFCSAINDYRAASVQIVSDSSVTTPVLQVSEPSTCFYQATLSMPSSCSPNSPPKVSIKANGNGYCLDIPFDDTTTGSSLVMDICDATGGQLWAINADESISSSLNSNKCIGVDGYSNGSNLVIQDCVNGDVDQKWMYLADGSFQSMGNPLYCFDENGLGNTVYLWQCDGSSDQFFTLVGGSQPTPTPPPTPTPVTEVTIVSDVDGFCVDIPGSDTSNGVDLILWGCHGGDNQKWLLSTSGTGPITSVLDSSKCVDVEGGVYADGTPIELQDCSYISSQEWEVMADGTIQSVDNPNYCWDGNNHDNVVYLWTCDGTSDQYFSTPSASITTNSTLLEDMEQATGIQ